jgi:hypothetical protein
MINTWSRARAAVLSASCFEWGTGSILRLLWTVTHTAGSRIMWPCEVKVTWHADRSRFCLLASDNRNFVVQNHRRRETAWQGALLKKLTYFRSWARECAPRTWEPPHWNQCRFFRIVPWLLSTELLYWPINLITKPNPPNRVYKMQCP